MITYRATACDPALRAGRAALDSIAICLSNAIEGRDVFLVMPVGEVDERLFFPSKSNRGPWFPEKTVP